MFPQIQFPILHKFVRRNVIFVNLSRSSGINAEIMHPFSPLQNADLLRSYRSFSFFHFFVVFPPRGWIGRLSRGRGGQSYLLAVFTRSQSTTPSPALICAFCLNKSERVRAPATGGAIIKTNIPFSGAIVRRPRRRRAVPRCVAPLAREKRKGPTSFQACTTVHADPR